MNIFNLNKKKVQKFHNKAQEFSDEGNDEEAIKLYLKAIGLDSTKSESFYNIGLIYKYQGNWNKSYEYNLQAYKLNSEDEATRWNLAIAATALRKWDDVRSIWKDNGINIDGESGPIEMDFGMTPVRLNPEDDGEVVWATRIDPVRARLDSIPYKESGFKHGDIVLHDGAAVGYREVGDNEYPVFNVLELFESSKYVTSVATVLITKDEDLKVLEEIFSQSEHDFEDWTTNIRTLCRQCSEGRPHDHHDNELENEWSSERTLGVAVGGNSLILQLFEQWEKSTGAKLIDIEE